MEENEDCREENVDSCRTQFGELRLRLYYSVDHVLPLEIYKPLHSNLINSLALQPFCASPAGILEYLPSVQIYFHKFPLFECELKYYSFEEILQHVSSNVGNLS